jgi:hypothetical protein
MGTTEIIVLLVVLGAVFIIGFAWLMGVLTPRKINETHCPFCEQVIKKGSIYCAWCGKELPTQEKT